jgi:hypothetical protein
MSDLRKKAVAAGLGDRPPSWERKGLGIADRDPERLVRGLGLVGFKGTGSDWIADIYKLLSIAVRSSYLNGLYSDPRPSYTSRSISIGAAGDLHRYSPAVMRRMIMSTLWAAERTGRIAMPSKLEVEIAPGQTGLWIKLR